MVVQSITTGKKYNPSECVSIVNLLQVYKYLENGANLLDIICGEDNRLVYVFSREGTKELYNLWCNHSL